jgi:transcriptional regulator with XRE-family HTH domain
MITLAQSRAARALIDWSQEELAKAAHLGLSTIRDFEKGRRVPTHNNLAGIKFALEAAGVLFVAENGQGPGVRLRRLEKGDRVKFTAESGLPAHNNIDPNEIGVVLEREAPAPVSYIGDVVIVQFGDRTIKCTSQALRIVT